MAGQEFIEFSILLGIYTKQYAVLVVPISFFFHCLAAYRRFQSLSHLVYIPSEITKYITVWVNVILLIFGLVAIIIAIFGKKFTVADSEGFEFKSKTPMPTWLGKLIAGIVGAAFVLYGLISLLSQSSR